MLAEAAHVRLWRVSSAWTEMVREPVPRGRALTLDEWSALPDDEPGELVDGFLMEEELPDPVHELAVSWFVFLFRSWLGRAGFVFTSDLKVQVTGNSGRKPDLTIIRNIERASPMFVPEAGLSCGFGYRPFEGGLALKRMAPARG